MSDDLVKQAMSELTDVVRCRCNEAYTGRGLHDPDCQCDSAEAVKVVADHIEELEAKLRKSALQELSALGQASEAYQAQLAAEARIVDIEAKLVKAVEAKRQACANVVKHFYEKGQVTKPEDIMNRTTLAELKGQDDE